MHSLTIKAVFVWFTCWLWVGCGNDYFEKLTSLDSDDQRYSDISVATNSESLDLEVQNVAEIDEALKNRNLYLKLETSLKDQGEALTQDTLWAIGQCQCSSSFIGSLLDQWLSLRGILPQILTPAIKSEVQNNQQLKLLLSLPEFIQSFLKEKFANDEKISQEIRTGIITKVKTALNITQSFIESKSVYRFDHFFNVFNKSADNSRRLEFFLVDQVLRWQIIFSADEMWKQQKSLIKNDHGLQLLATMQAMSELQYLFGLKKDQDGKPYGGLTLELGQGSTKKLGPYDPREQPNEKRFVSGGFRIQFENSDLVQMATEVKESWQPNYQEVSLDEQAKLWLLGAQILQRLRPTARTFTMNLFGQGKGIFPQDAHGIGLIILSTMDALLNGPFVEQTTKLIRNQAVIEGEVNNKQATLLELSRLSFAVMAWIKAVEDISDLTALSKDTAKLKQAPEKLTRLLHLVGQTMLRDYLINITDQLTLAQYFEVITAMVMLDKQIYQSQFFKNNIRKSLLFVIQQKLSKVLTTTAVFSLADVLWFYRMVRELKQSFLAEELKQLSSAVDRLKLIIVNWDQSYVNAVE